MLDPIQTFLSFIAAIASVIAARPIVKREWEERKKRKQEEEKDLLGYSLPDNWQTVYRPWESIEAKERKKEIVPKIIEKERKRRKLMDKYDKTDKETYRKKICKLQDEIDSLRTELSDLDGHI